MLAAGVAQCGGRLQPTKSKAYATDEVKEGMAAGGVTLPAGVAWGANKNAAGEQAFGLVIAGTPIGERQFVLNHVSEVVQSVLATTTTVTDKLLTASANDHALQCMRLSLRQRVNFLQQVVPPTPDVMAEYERLDVGLGGRALIVGLCLRRRG